MKQISITHPSQQGESQGIAALLKTPAYAKRFEQVLGNRAPQFISSLITAGTSPALRNSNPISVIAAGMVAATLDLPIDKNLGFAHIVAYKGVAQFQMGYKGYIQLALRSGQYLRMNAKPINAEAFGGYDDVGEPIIKWEAVDETKPILGYAFAWKLVNGFTKTCYWPDKKVEEHGRKYSQAFRQEKKDSPWFIHSELMKLKTVISNELRRWGILSVELQTALRHDQGVQESIDGDIEFIDIPSEGAGDAPTLPNLGGTGDIESPPPDATEPQNQPEFVADTPQKRVAMAAADSDLKEAELMKFLRKQHITKAQTIASMTDDEANKTLNDWQAVLDDLAS